MKMKMQLSQKWIAIFGQCKYDQIGKLTYIPTQPSEDSLDKSSHGLFKSNIWFESGTITFRTKIKDANSKALIGFNLGKNFEVFAGIGSGAGAYGISTFSNGVWGDFANVGQGTKAPINEEIKVTCTSNGSEFSLSINDIQVCSGMYRISKCQIGFYINGLEEVEIWDIKITERTPAAFIVMQFTQEFDELYSEVIAPACVKYGLKPIRADDMYTNGLIIEDIMSAIREASIVIADITPNNANVYYEVGYAHGIGKETIFLSERKTREKLPFDVAGIRTIFYDNSIRGKTKIEEQLNKHLSRIYGEASE